MDNRRDSDSETPASQDTSSDTREPSEAQEDKGAKKPKLVQIDKLRPEGYEGSCLRPLGLCDLGSCDACWYSPDHPRFHQDKK